MYFERSILWFVACCLLCVVSRGAQPQTAPAGQAHVLTIIGAPGTPLYERHYGDWAKRFEDYFARRSCRVSGIGYRVSGEMQARDAKPETRNPMPASAAAIRDKIAQIAKQAQPADQFILILLGHGGAEGSFVVPGPDLTVKDLAESLAAVKAGNQVILNFASASGASLRALRQPGRAVITATSLGEANDSDFPEFFLQALESASPSSSIILLDAFNTASNEYAQWITRQRQTEEGWTIEGRKSLAIFKKLYDGQDVPPTRRLAPSGSDGSKDDPILPLVPDGDAKVWAGRRLVAEHPLLDDTGQSEGAAAITSAGFRPLTPGAADDLGALAARIILGQPGLRPGGGK